MSKNFISSTHIQYDINTDQPQQANLINAKQKNERQEDHASF